MFKTAKMKSNTIYIALYFLMFFVHFGIFMLWKTGFETTFVKYYLFLTVLFSMVITIISIMKKIYPQYIGFAFLGLVMFKLILMFLIMKKLNLGAVPNYKLHFIIPYLISLVLETLYSINIIKEHDASSAEKREESEE